MIKMEDCEHGRLYRVDMRNGSLGVWNKESKGFIFIRTKFSDRYLFTEYHYDFDRSVGTATPTEALPDRVPEGIRIHEYKFDNSVIRCALVHGRVLDWAVNLGKIAAQIPRDLWDKDIEVDTKPDPDRPGRYMHVVAGTDIKLPWEIQTGNFRNKELFQWFETMEAKYKE